MGRHMLNRPINLFPRIAECLPQLTKTYKLILIIEGDLLHQKQKLAQSGLERYFKDAYIVSEK